MQVVLDNMFKLELSLPGLLALTQCPVYIYVGHGRMQQLKFQ